MSDLTPEAREELTRLAEDAHYWGGSEQELGDGVLALLAQIDRAEARVKAVRDVLDRAHDEFENPDDADIRRALDG